MTGKQRVLSVLAGGASDRLPVLPIVHTGLAAHVGVPLGRYFTDAEAMAEVIRRGYELFGYDGVQLTLGVVAEPEALGAHVVQPPDAAPLLKERLLADLDRLSDLRRRDVAAGGRIPMYNAAVRRVVDEIGSEAFVISTLRGPLNIASQLRGVEDMLIDMIERPDVAARLLEFATEVAIRVAQAARSSGADAVMFGEAACSPNFIAPAMYRNLVQPWHARMVSEVRRAGWRFVGLHVCGGILPILDDLIATGADLLDVDYQVPVREAIRAGGGRVALRGNLNPTELLLQGTPEEVLRETQALCVAAAGARWIVGSGCDVPPGTPAANLHAMVRVVKGA